MQVRRGLLAIGLAAGLLLGWAAVSAADSDATPEERCAAAKLRAVGKTVQLRLSCIARGTVSLDFDPDTCLLKAQAQLVAAFAKAEKGECATLEDAGDWELEAQDFVDTVEIDLAP
jgi:hypothetical protein